MYKMQVKSQQRMRALKKSDEELHVTIVSTPLQLMKAVERGSLHIEIRDHLDLTKVTPRDFKGSTYRMLSPDPSDDYDSEDSSSSPSRDHGWIIRVSELQ